MDDEAQAALQAAAVICQHCHHLVSRVEALNPHLQEVQSYKHPQMGVPQSP